MSVFSIDRGVEPCSFRLIFSEIYLKVEHHQIVTNDDQVHYVAFLLVSNTSHEGATREFVRVQLLETQTTGSEISISVKFDPEDVNF